MRLFELGYVYNNPPEINLKLGKLIQGKVESGILAQMIYNAGGGNHLEIGTYYGGSAIVAGIIKKKYHLSGKIFTIDPENRGELENFRRYRVDDIIEKIKSNSYPLPVNQKFTTAYIDGDHRWEHPLQDWNSVKDITSKYILFDDCDMNNKHVVKACISAMEDPEWMPVLMINSYCLFEKIKNEFKKIP